MVLNLAQAHRWQEDCQRIMKPEDSVPPVIKTPETMPVPLYQCRYGVGGGDGKSEKQFLRLRIKQ